jgi:hypothetical protein
MIFAAVDVRFRAREIQRLCSDSAALKGRWGADAASAVAQSLDELSALERLGDLETLPYIALRRSKDGVIRLDSIGGVRMRMTVRADAGVSWKAATSVVIVAIEILHHGAEEDDD